MKKLILLTLFCVLIYNVDAQTSFNTCPNANVAIAREGTNNDNTNPVYLYNITSSGVLTPLAGPIMDPNNPTTNLQINGTGLNSNDGFLYGLKSASLSIATINLPVPFYRIGSDAVAQQVGKIAPPLLGATESTSFVNPAVGEFDGVGNFYFSAASGAVGGTILAPTFTVKRLFIGKLSGITGSGPSTATITPSYTEIQAGDANVSAYLNTLTTTYTTTTIQDISNSGLNDLVYDRANNMLYSYVIYSNASGTFGLMLKLDPSTGILTSVNNTVPGPSPFVDASVGVSGTLLDANGNFLIMFTNGQIYKANTSSPGVFTGTISQLSNNTGTVQLPNPLRGDLASCGAAILLPISLDYFNAYNQNNTAVLKWQTSSEINATSFIVEKSSNAVSWTAVQTIATVGSGSTVAQYQFIDKDINGATTYYYRLKLVDLDGSFKYSVVKKTSFDASAGTLSCYPNPARNTLYVESNAAFSGDVKVQVSNMLGKTISPAFKRIDNKITLDVSGLSAGLYILQISEGNNVRTQKLVKQ